MREIKFRVFDTDHKIMEAINDLYWFEENGVHDARGEGFGVHYVLMQYTGLKDKNGVDAYWDDIVEDGINPPFAITWDYALLARLAEIEFEVIGNIYENKDLL